MLTVLFWEMCFQYLVLAVYTLIIEKIENTLSRLFNVEEFPSLLVCYVVPRINCTVKQTSIKQQLSLYSCL